MNFFSDKFTLFFNALPSWYPPGSGEVFSGLARSGLLDQFTKAGKEYMFISNVENLGATIDCKVPIFFLSKNTNFFLVSRRT